MDINIQQTGEQYRLTIQPLDSHGNPTTGRLVADPTFDYDHNALVVTPGPTQLEASLYPVDNAPFGTFTVTASGEAIQRDGSTRAFTCEWNVTIVDDVPTGIQAGAEGPFPR